MSTTKWGIYEKTFALTSAGERGWPIFHSPRSSLVFPIYESKKIRGRLLKKSVC